MLEKTESLLIKNKSYFGIFKNHGEPLKSVCEQMYPEGYTQGLAHPTFRVMCLNEIDNQVIVSPFVYNSDMFNKDNDYKEFEINPNDPSYAKTAKIYYDEKIIREFMNKSRGINGPSGQFTAKDGETPEEYIIRGIREQHLRNKENAMSGTCAPTLNLTYLNFVFFSCDAPYMFGEDINQKIVVMNKKTTIGHQVGFNMQYGNNNPYSGEKLGYITRGVIQEQYKTDLKAAQKIKVIALLDCSKGNPVIHVMDGAGVFCHENLRKEVSQLTAEYFLEAYHELTKNNLNPPTIYFSAHNNLEYDAWTKALKKYSNSMENLKITKLTQRLAATVLLEKGQHPVLTVAGDMKGRGHGIFDVDSASEEAVFASCPLYPYLLDPAVNPYFNPKKTMLNIETLSSSGSNQIKSGLASSSSFFDTNSTVKITTQNTSDDQCECLLF